MPGRRRASARRDRAPAAHRARLLAAPHGLPGDGLDRLGHLLPLLHRRRPVAGAPRLRARAHGQRSRLEPEPGGDRGPAGHGRGAVVARRRLLLPGLGAQRARDRGGQGLRPGRDGPRLRARDLAVPAPAPGGGGHVQGGGRARLSRDGARLDGLVRRALEAHAVVVLLLRVGRPGRREQGNRREGRGPVRGRHTRRSPLT